MSDTNDDLLTDSRLRFVRVTDRYIIRGITYIVTVHGIPDPEKIKEAIEYQAQCLAEKLLGNDAEKTSPEHRTKALNDT